METAKVSDVICISLKVHIRQFYLNYGIPVNECFRFTWLFHYTLNTISIGNILVFDKYLGKHM